MVDWNTGQPNARYWALKLIHDHFGPGDKLVEAHTGLSGVYAKAFITPNNEHKILLINKRDRLATVSLAGTSGGHVEYVDPTTGENPPGNVRLPGDEINLNGYSVAVVTLPVRQ